MKNWVADVIFHGLYLAIGLVFAVIGALIFGTQWGFHIGLGTYLIIVVMFLKY